MKGRNWPVCEVQFSKTTKLCVAALGTTTDRRYTTPMVGFRCIAVIGLLLSNPILHATENWFSVSDNHVLHKTAHFQVLLKPIFQPWNANSRNYNFVYLGTKTTLLLKGNNIYENKSRSRSGHGYVGALNESPFKFRSVKSSCL